MRLWTGLVCLIPDPKCREFNLFDGKGAYVHVVAWADSEVHFEQRVRGIAVEQLGCIVQEVESVEPLESNMQADDLPEEFLEMRETANRQKDDVVFGTFYTWDESDVN